MEENQEPIELKHLRLKCPVCGNSDFVRVKKSQNGWISWDIESDMEIYGCTKCYFLMHFSESAVLTVLDNEEDRTKIQKEIEKCENEIASLEEEVNVYEKRLLELETESSQFKSCPSYLQEKIDAVKKELECNLKWRIKLFNKEIERLKSGAESNEYWPKYNHYSLQNSYFFEEHWKMFDEMKMIKTKINEICEALNKEK